MELDARLLLTLGGMLVSVVSAAAIVRQKLSTVIEQLADTEQRLRKIDQRIDLLDNYEAVVKQRLDILAKMNAPDVLERRYREVAGILSDIKYLKDETARLRHQHNGAHPPVASARRAS
jgi:GTP1/Obg family GTP-binding protein